MTVLETLAKQQPQFDELALKKFTAIDLIIKQQHRFNNIFIDVPRIIRTISPIPKQTALLNINKLFFDNISKLNQSFKWIEDYQRISKSFSQLNNFFEIGQNYTFIEREFSEEFDYSKADFITEAPTLPFLSETQRVKKIIREIYLNNHNLFKIQPREFEQIIAELLYDQGFEVQLTKQTRDNGYDILALKYIGNFSPVKYLVECKRYNEKRKIGVEIVRSFKEVIATEQANKGIIVTTSYFTKDAINKQKETPYLLDYKNKDEVINWVNEYMNK